MAKILKEKIIRDANDKFVCGIIMDCDDSAEGYSVELYDEDTSETTSFGLGDAAKSKCELLFKALSNYCDECFKKSKGDVELFWSLVAEEFSSGWLLADDYGMINTTIEDLERFSKFTLRWEDNLVGNIPKIVENKKILNTDIDTEAEKLIKQYNSKVDDVEYIKACIFKYEKLLSSLKYDLYTEEDNLRSVKAETRSSGEINFKKKYDLEDGVNSKYLVFDEYGCYIETVIPECSIDDFDKSLKKKGLSAHRATSFIRDNPIDWYYISFKEMLRRLEWEFDKNGRII